MPEFDEVDLRARIAEKEIRYFSIDTNVIDGLNRSGQLNHPMLRSIAKLSSKGVAFVMSDVVVGEVTSHINDLHLSTTEELAKSLKRYGKVWASRSEEIAGFSGALASVAQSLTTSTDVVDGFLKESKISVIKSSEYCNLEVVLTKYFTGEPPFASGTKKFEFPDALALESLESWAAQNGAMLLVSRDKGWQSYCRESEYLYCCADLPKGLSLFYEDEALVKLILTQSEKELNSDLINMLAETAQRDLDDLDFEVQADAFMNWDCQLEHAIVNRVRLRIGADDPQEIIGTDAETVTFVVPIEADIEVAGGFDFSVYDSIDGDDVMIGGNVSTVNLTHRYEVTVVASGKGQKDAEEIDIYEATLNPSTRLREVDFGFVEPFYEPDPED